MAAYYCDACNRNLLHEQTHFDFDLNRQMHKLAKRTFPGIIIELSHPVQEVPPLGIEEPQQ